MKYCKEAEDSIGAFKEEKDKWKKIAEVRQQVINKMIKVLDENKINHYFNVYKE